MKNKRRMKWVMTLNVTCLMIAIVACSTGAKLASPTAPATSQEIIITQVVTQVVVATTAPPPPTPIPSPTLPPTPTATFDPLSAPIYYPLKDCVASRLHIGDTAMVSLVGGPNGIRYGRDMHYDTIIAEAQPGQLLQIIDGPWCSHGWIVWMVKTADGLVGYTPEGNGNEYWLFPIRK